MYYIAIVEDDAAFAAELQEMIKKYQKEHNISFKIAVFGDGEEIIAGYQPFYDIILLDIDMPHLNGMETAEQIRKTDHKVVLMFITNMVSYAIKGYEVGALDFLMKPVTYYTFSMKLTRAMKRVKQKSQQHILLTLPDGVKKLGTHQILYVEVQKRILHYHTNEGEYVIRGTMTDAEKILNPALFAKCNHWYTVNLEHVSEVRKNVVVVGNTELEISRRRRTAFLKALTEYIGGAP